MEISIEVTKNFEKDYKKFSKKDQEKIKEKINMLIGTFRDNGSTKQLYRLHKIELPQKLSSSLFIYKIDLKLRAILTFEKDPLFDQTIFTFFRVVNHSELETAFNSISESLYQNLFNSKDKTNGRD